MRFVADTHCLLWYLQGDVRLSPNSRLLFENLERERQVVIPTIVLAELLYVLHKVKTPISFKHLCDMLAKEPRFEIVPLSLAVVQEAIDLTFLALHDAVIVATARLLAVPLMTRDETILKAGIVKTLTP